MKRLVRSLVNRFGIDVHTLPRHTSGVYQEADSRRLCEEAGKRSPLKLHFGCGPRIFKGWANFDLAYNPFDPAHHGYGSTYPPDLRGGPEDFFAVDVTQIGLPLRDDSVDFIFHEDFFEHLNQRQQFVFLAETLRVLKPGCTHRVSTPNLAATFREGYAAAKGAAGVPVHEWDRHGHVSVLTPQMLEEMARMVGYKTVVFTDKNQCGSEFALPEFRPSDDRLATGGNIFADLRK